MAARRYQSFCNGIRTAMYTRTVHMLTQTLGNTADNSINVVAQRKTSDSYPAERIRFNAQYTTNGRAINTIGSNQRR